MCPACLCGREAAGHNALRGSGPNRKHPFKDALTHAGCPDPRIDLVCITSSVLANSFNFKRHRRCLSHLLESLWLTQPVYSTSIPRSRRRPQHQKQTSAHVRTMSALPPKSDIDRACRDVRFVPKADILRCGKKRRYFDRLAGARYSALMPAAVIGVARTDRTNRPASFRWIGSFKQESDTCRPEANPSRY